MRRVIFNQKGGVGKTTIACNLAAINAHLGRRTLVVDLDPQSNSTHYLLGKPPEELSATLADFFDQTISVRFSRKPLSEFIMATPWPGLDILPAHPELESMQDKLLARHKIYKLRDGLNKLEDYQDVFMDTPPAMNFFTQSALIAADRCIIPFDCDDFARRALYGLMEAVEELREDHNPNLRVEGILVNQFQANARLPQRLVAELEDEGQPMLKTRLSPSVKVRESHDAYKPLIHLDPKHKLTGEFLALYQELHPSTAGA
ncbi:MAG: ParA family protein [Chromatiales bacterium]|nr:ParA family protein [Chromatiales bacterium]